MSESSKQSKKKSPAKPSASAGVKRQASGSKSKSAVRKTSRGGTQRILVPDPADAKAPQLAVRVPTEKKKSKNVSSATKKEAAYHVKVLEKNAQLSRDGNLREGQTHALEKDESGNAMVVRKRFSAI